MAYKNQIIYNPRTKQDIKFLQTGRETGGLLLEMESTYNAHSVEPGEHYHPYQVEDFTVLSGELTVRMDGKLIILNQGDTLHIPPKKIHAMWNNSDNKTVVNWKVKPAMNTENLLETVTGLAIEGKTNSNGVPNILQASLILNKYSGEFRLSSPSYLVQQIFFKILTPVAYLFGYRPTYKKYTE